EEANSSKLGILFPTQRASIMSSGPFLEANPMYQQIRLALVALFGVSVLAIPLRAADTRHPNIVFIFSDDHGYQAISAYNDPRKLIQTPNIDRIGREGMRFDRCLVPNSICGPSRATVLTGKYSHANGFYNNTPAMRFDGSQV